MSWNPENSITEKELERIVKKKLVTEFHIRQSSSGGFYVTVLLGDTELYLATRREIESPRIFRDIGKLLANIQKRFHIEPIYLHLNHVLRGKAEVLK